MKTYEVTFEVTYTLLVEARSKEEAMEIASHEELKTWSEYYGNWGAEEVQPQVTA